MIEPRYPLAVPGGGRHRPRRPGGGGASRTRRARGRPARAPRAARRPRRSTASSPRRSTALHDPRLLPDADALRRRGSARARAAGERVLVFGDFDADGLTGLAILTIAFRRLGIEVDPVRPEPARRGPRPVAARRSRPRREAGATVIVTVDCGTTSLPEIAEAQATRDRRARHRPSPRARRSCPAAVAIVNPQRADSALPGAPPGRERRRLQARPAAPRRRAWRPGGGPRAGGPGDDRQRRRRRRRSSARRGRSSGSAWSGCGRSRGPGSSRSSPPPGSRPTAVDMETIGFALAPRINAAGRVGEALVAARLLLAEDAGGGRRRSRRSSRRRTSAGGT